MHHERILALALAFAVASALFPATASRAGLGTIFTQNPCPEFSEVRDAYDFRESFVGFAKCESLCKQATSSCKKAMKAAASCQLAFAADWTAFDSAVDCDPLPSAERKECIAGWKSDLKSWQQSIKNTRGSGVGVCDDFLNNPNTGCLRRCSGV